MKHEMQSGVSHNYYLIEKAICYIASHSQSSRSIEELAEEVNLKADDFRRIFTKWAGVEPETFSRYLSHNLRKREGSNLPDLFDTAVSKRSSKPKRLHDRFLNIVKMDPDNYKNGGEPLIINYSVQLTPFGRMMAASTGKGICRVSFLSEKQECINILEKEFPEAQIRQKDMPEHSTLADFFRKTGLPETMINLNVKGTLFQISVWEMLLRIPEGELGSCSDVAKEIENPKAVRAVGSAVGKNPIAFFIPCHRIVPAAGGFGNYRWGENRKIAMIGWEEVKKSDSVRF